MNAIRWTEPQYGDYQARRSVQLPLGRGVRGLDRLRRINNCALEWQEAQQLIRWTDGEGVKMFPELAYLYAVPNGGFRHKAVAGKMKAQGVREGALDFNLDVARGPYHSLRLELKRRIGGTVSPAQQRWIAWHIGQGNLAIVCRGWEEARDRLVDYLSTQAERNCGVEQQSARLAHNQEVGGANPPPATF